MRARTTSITVLVAALFWGAPASAQAPSAPGLFHDIGYNSIGGFGGYDALWHVGAIGATALLVTTGADDEVHGFFRDHPGYGLAGAPGAVVGSIGPVLVGGGLWIAGLSGGDADTVGAGQAVLQAAGITLVYVTLLKLVTGRPPPREEGVDGRTFRFGIYRGGVFWGWPSGHTAATMATASTLAAYYPGKIGVQIAGYTSVAYMMFSVSAFHDGGMHWLSDAVAAAMFAYPIGKTVGKSYRGAMDAQLAAPAVASITPVVASVAPVVAPGFVGVRLGGAF